MHRINKPYFIDIEASGFGRGSYPIEIGYTNGGDSYCSLIKPPQDWTHWDHKAERVHGISREILFEHGKSGESICVTLNEQLRGITLYTDAWGNDSSWLWKLYDHYDIAPTFKLESVRKIISEQQLSQWHQCKEAILNTHIQKRHRASYDALLLQKTYLELQQSFKYQA